MSESNGAVGDRPANAEEIAAYSESSISTLNDALSRYEEAVKAGDDTDEILVEISMAHENAQAHLMVEADDDRAERLLDAVTDAEKTLSETDTSHSVGARARFDPSVATLEI